MAETERKYCEDCRWVKLASNPEWFECLSPKNMGTIEPSLARVSRAATKPRPIYRFCETMRKESVQGETVCGPAAAWFEPKTAEEVAA